MRFRRLTCSWGLWARGEAAGWRDGEAVWGVESWAGGRRRVPGGRAEGVLVWKAWVWKALNRRLMKSQEM